MSQVDTEIAFCEAKIAKIKKKMAWMEKHRDLLEATEKWDSFSDDHIDFEELSHKEVISVIRTLGGKWEKNPEGNDRITYRNDKNEDGLVIRCYKGEPPPSCRVVEVEEHVPAVVIPASVRKVRKIVCAPSLSAAIAAAAESVQKGDQP